eukprot:1155105-Pelagomonas_calceolata.AAC.3
MPITHAHSTPRARSSRPCMLIILLCTHTACSPYDLRAAPPASTPSVTPGTSCTLKAPPCTPPAPTLPPIL